jgi:hypothetical protein
MTYVCPHCMNDVGSSLLEYSLDIVARPNSFEFPCPRCNQTIGASVSIRFDLRGQASTEESAS